MGLTQAPMALRAAVARFARPLRVDTGPLHQAELLASDGAEGDEFVPVEVQPAGKRRMTYEEFLRGLR